MLRLSSDLTPPRIRSMKGRDEIFDPCRRKWVALTPEEWTRQQLLQQFTEVLQIPSSLISVEKEMEINGLKKRYDLLVFDDNGSPWLLAECKAPTIKLASSVMEQLLRYHIQIPVPYLIIGNGEETRGWQKETYGLVELMQWPSFQK